MFTTPTSVLVVTSALIAILNSSVSCTQSACTVNAGWCPTSTGYDANDLTIVDSQGNVCLPGGTIPKNGYRCFKHRFCSNNCRLRTWSRNLPLTVKHPADSNNPTTVYLKTPKLPSPYRKNDICVYNISLSGCPSTVRVNFDQFTFPGIANSTDSCTDYVQFHDGQLHTKRCGNQTGEYILLPSSNFLVLFFSDKLRTPEDKGFNLRTQCG